MRAPGHKGFFRSDQMGWKGRLQDAHPLAILMVHGLRLAMSRLRIAASCLSSRHVTQGCTRPQKVQLARIPSFLWDFPFVVGPNHSIPHQDEGWSGLSPHLHILASICPVDSWDHLQSALACSEGGASRRPEAALLHDFWVPSDLSLTVTTSSLN